MSRRFTRTVEDFVCENCAATVTGTGYTNHCPRCLWSKHVDEYPGDRLAECQGLMRPMQVLVEGDQYVLVHQCVRCGLVKRNRADRVDDRGRLRELFAPPGLEPPVVPRPSRAPRRPTRAGTPARRESKP